jgi:hypothetical protein
MSLLLLLPAALPDFCQSLPDKNTALPMHRILSGGPAIKNLLFAACKFAGSAALHCCCSSDIFEWYTLLPQVVHF